MKYESIFRAIAARPWAILPSKMNEIMAMLEWRAMGNEIAPEQVQAAMAGQRQAVPGGGGVAVIPVMGTIYHRANLMQQTSGGTTSTSLASAVREAVSDPSIGSILMHVDTPGGEAAGLPELSEMIFNAGQQKPIIAVADGMAASAGYFIASSATEFYATPSSDVGSIGTLMAHTDVSGAEEKAGIKTTIIKAGENKAFGHPYSPLSDADHATLQKMVDDANEMFVSGVARNRNVSKATVNNTFGQGLMFNAREAKELNMVDGVKTLDQVVERAMQVARKASTRRRAVAAMALADSSLARR